MSISKVLAVVVSGLVTGVSLMACSSAPAESAAESSEALKCPVWGCAETCYADPYCTASATTWTLSPVWLDGHLQQALTDEMIAYGCTTPIRYAPDSRYDFPGDWSLSTCPIGAPADIQALAMPGCDPCTGGPPLEDHFFVEWQNGNSNPSGCHTPPACAARQ
jgi:hypothetical protein